MNILTTENLASHNTKGATSGVGEWVLRNGVWSIAISPAPYYQNYTVDGNKVSYCLKDEFISNTQYYVNLWMDGDDVYTSNAYRSCGLTIYYSDNTYLNMVINSGSDGTGWNHKEAITDASKSVNRVEVYYYTNLPVYYRYDSFIIPLTANAHINKNGVLNCDDVVESMGQMSTRIGKNYMMVGRDGQFIEW